MTYLLLIIIAILIYIAFFTPEKREKRAIRRVQKIFNTQIPPPPTFDINDPRNKTHPDETVIYSKGLGNRKLAVLLNKMEHPSSEGSTKKPSARIYYS